MGFQDRLRLLEPVDTWPGLERAAIERFWDATELAVSHEGRRTAALYLYGYVVEIALKVAFFRLLGWPAAQPIQLKALNTHAAWQGKNGHDLAAIVDVLIAERCLPGNVPFNPVFAASLKRRVLTTASHWREVIRYRCTAAAQAEVAEAYECAEWILENRKDLWR
jgi:hypothetical protein